PRGQTSPPPLAGIRPRRAFARRRNRLDGSGAAGSGAAPALAAADPRGRVEVPGDARSRVVLLADVGSPPPLVDEVVAIADLRVGNTHEVEEDEETPAPPGRVAHAQSRQDLGEVDAHLDADLLLAVLREGALVALAAVRHRQE